MGGLSLARQAQQHCCTGMAHDAAAHLHDHLGIVGGDHGLALGISLEGSPLLLAFLCASVDIARRHSDLVVPLIQLKHVGMQCGAKSHGRCGLRPDSVRIEIASPVVQRAFCDLIQAGLADRVMAVIVGVLHDLLRVATRC